MSDARKTSGPRADTTLPLIKQDLAELMGEAVNVFYLSVVEGPAAGERWRSNGPVCSIGSHETNDLVIPDPTVSRFHCELTVSEDVTTVRDLGSRNGTVLDGVTVREALVRNGSLLRLGDTAVRFEPGVEVQRLPLSDETAFGPLIGCSPAMRACFAVLHRAALTETTVLLTGETGTGKELAASGLHQTSARRGGPFVIVDCGAIPGELLESELFGHERGAFSGADARRIGAFEEASGGTIFLDEIGDLPLELQPKLLRVLERRQIRRVGSSTYNNVDVRVVAATHRDLRAMVNEGTFRPDLYYRLAVVRVELPPLRKRPDDIPMLAEHMLQAFAPPGADLAWARSPEFLRRLEQSAWPGNVRELRNYLERCLVFQEPQPVSAVDVTLPDVSTRLPYSEARRAVLADFERQYASALLSQYDGNISAAARAAGIDRAYLYRILRRAGLPREG